MLPDRRPWTGQVLSVSIVVPACVSSATRVGHGVPALGKDVPPNVLAMGCPSALLGTTDQRHDSAFGYVGSPSQPQTPSVSLAGPKWCPFTLER